MDSRSSKLKIVLPYLSILIISVLYLFLRLGFTQTIEFGYDQPLLAMNVLDFLKNPSFIDSYKFVGVNPWGAPSWGVAQLFFWTPVLLVTKDPILISQFAVLFNLVGVVLIFFLGEKFFSPTVGVLAALILATHPWYVVFSRMIYQPTPVITLVVLSMFLSFYLLEKPKTKEAALLILVWAFLYQTYIHTFSLIVTSAGLLLLNIKMVSKKYLTLGIVLSIILFSPVIYFFIKNPTETNSFSKVTDKFTELREAVPYSVKDITFEFLGIAGGGRFNWQLGYGYKDFLKTFPLESHIEYLGLTLVIFLISYHLIATFIDKEKRVKRLTLLLWFIGPVWFLTLIKTPIALPRYFLLSLPSLALLFALMIHELAEKVKSIKYIIYFIPVAISILWSIFIFKYYDFVLTYKYDRGFLSNFSDVPYSFLVESFDWVKDDAAKKGYEDYVVSSDFNMPSELRLNSTQRYYWDVVLENNKGERKNNVGYYLMYFSPVDPDYSGEYVQFGPYVVYEFKN